MKRPPEEFIGNIFLMKFLLEYWGALDNKIFDMAAANKDPDGIPPDMLRLLEVLNGFQEDIHAIVNGQNAGKDTKRLEEDLLCRFIEEISGKAKFAIEKSSPHDIAALVPREFLFKGIDGILKKYGGDKISALISLSERQRNFDDCLDKKTAKPKPPKPS